MEPPCMWPCITPIDYFPMLDPTLKASRASSFFTIRLLVNDNSSPKIGRAFLFKAQVMKLSALVLIDLADK